MHQSAEFSKPELAAVAAVLQQGLQNHFEHVDIQCVPSPDLRNIGVTYAGLGGSTALIEFGGEPYAHNPAYRGTNVDILEMLAATGIPNPKVIGAAMADADAIGGNCGEMIANSDPATNNQNRVARVGDRLQCLVEPYAANTCGPIANFFVSEGQPGPVIQLEVKKRIGGEFSLTQAVRESLTEFAQRGNHIGMGGVIELVEGRVKSHVMPNYECLIDGYYDTSKEQVVKDFLQFYEHMGPGLILFPTLWTGDPTGGNLNLRTSGEHTHFYHSDDSKQQAGHYHGDVTAGDVHYRGYLNLASQIFRFGDIYAELGIKP